MSAVSAQTKVKSGFNLFSTDQDIEIGRRSAAEVERKLPMIRDSSVEAYVGAIGKRLAAVMPGATFPYQFKVVNASDINAFALPGGYMYLNRGLIEAAKNEGQLAGVLAHEMSHVALRHGTQQASKAYLGQAGLGILGGLMGKAGDSTERVMGTVGGFGLNALFLKFSRTDEEQADIVGAGHGSRLTWDMVDSSKCYGPSKRTIRQGQAVLQQPSAPQDLADRIRARSRATIIQRSAASRRPDHAAVLPAPARRGALANQPFARRGAARPLRGRRPRDRPLLDVQYLETRNRLFIDIVRL